MSRTSASHPLWADGLFTGCKPIFSRNAQACSSRSHVQFQFQVPVSSFTQSRNSNWLYLGPGTSSLFFIPYMWAVTTLQKCSVQNTTQKPEKTNNNNNHKKNHGNLWGNKKEQVCCEAGLTEWWTVQRAAMISLPNQISLKCQQRKTVTEVK